MSTSLKTVVGEKEIYDRLSHTSSYAEERLLITSFYGGIRRGKCVSITIPSRQIQLTKEGVENLVNVLQDWLENK